MKKNIFSIAAILLATVVIFSSCGKDDINNPVVTLTGDDVMEIELGETWENPGATAFDEEDGKLTSKIVVVGEVDSDKVGSYEIIYKVTDKAGNEGSATRTVNVKAGKLVHSYEVKLFDGETGDAVIDDDGNTIEYDITPESSSVYNRLIFRGFSGTDLSYKFDATVVGLTIYIEEKVVEPEQAGDLWLKLTDIEGTYIKSGDKYVITEFTYTEIQSENEDFSDADVFSTKEVWTLQ